MIRNFPLDSINRILKFVAILVFLVLFGFLSYIIGYMIGYDTKSKEVEVIHSNIYFTDCSIVIKDTEAERIEYSTLCEVDIQKLLVDKKVKKA